MEFTQLIKDYIGKELISDSEPEFLEGELRETNKHFAEINTVFKAPKNIREKLDLDKESLAIMLSCSILLIKSIKERKKKVDDFKKYIHQYESNFILKTK